MNGTKYTTKQHKLPHLFNKLGGIGFFPLESFSLGQASSSQFQWKQMCGKSFTNGNDIVEFHERCSADDRDSSLDSHLVGQWNCRKYRTTALAKLFNCLVFFFSRTVAARLMGCCCYPIGFAKEPFSNRFALTSIGYFRTLQPSQHKYSISVPLSFCFFWLNRFRIRQTTSFWVRFAFHFRQSSRNIVSRFNSQWSVNNPFCLCRFW